MKNSAKKEIYSALAVIRSLVLPRISDKLIKELCCMDQDDYRLLGKVVGQHERFIEDRFHSIGDAHELGQLKHLYCESNIENSIRSKFLLERFKELKPLVDEVTKQLSIIEDGLCSLTRERAVEGMLPDAIEDTFMRFGIDAQNKCMQMHKSL